MLCPFFFTPGLGVSIFKTIVRMTRLGMLVDSIRFTTSEPPRGLLEPTADGVKNLSRRQVGHCDVLSTIDHLTVS
jgi:hypothetical protein